VHFTRRAFIALGLSCIALPRVHAHEAGHAHHPDPEELALGSLADAELAFATIASHEGRRAAIFANAAPGAVLLEDRITAVRNLGSAALGPSHHQSQPAQIGLSRSHDFGYASGPFRGDDPAGAVDGVFLRLWRREAKRPWRIVVSAKVRTPSAVDFVPLGAAPRPAYTGKSDPAGARHEIAQLEARIAQRSHWPLSIASLLAPDLRWYREGAMPLAGRAAIARATEKGRQPGIDAPAAIHVGPTSDLAVAYGAARASSRAGWYFHVWLRRRDGAWRLAYDMASLPVRE